MATKRDQERVKALAYVRAADLKELREILEYANYRMDNLRSEKRREIRAGDIATFVVNKPRSGFHNTTLVGYVDRISRKAAHVSVPGAGHWRVSIMSLTPATETWQEQYKKNLKDFGPPTFRPKRKSRDRELLERLLGVS